MTEKILQNSLKNDRYNLTKTRQREDYKSFYLKKSTWKIIKTSRGWPEKSAISRFAYELNITRQYARDLVKQNVGCSSNVMRKIIEFLGIREGCWCHLFDKQRLDESDPRHPVFQEANQAKYMGEVPYDKHSESAEERKNDYGVETR